MLFLSSIVLAHHLEPVRAAPSRACTVGVIQDVIGIHVSSDIGPVCESSVCRSRIVGLRRDECQTKRYQNDTGKKKRKKPACRKSFVLVCITACTPASMCSCGVRGLTVLQIDTTLKGRLLTRSDPTGRSPTSTLACISWPRQSSATLCANTSSTSCWPTETSTHRPSPGTWRKRPRTGEWQWSTFS